MKFLKLFDSYQSLPTQINKRDYDLFQIKNNEQVKNSPIDKDLVNKLFLSIDHTKYLCTHSFSVIEIDGYLDSGHTEYLSVEYFVPKEHGKKDDPYYLILFNSDNRPYFSDTEEAIENNSVSYYLAESFDEVINFCKHNL